jgi:hypothetical protein
VTARDAWPLLTVYLRGHESHNPVMGVPSLEKWSARRSLEIPGGVPGFDDGVAAHLWDLGAVTEPLAVLP